jgi:hypothetical protein
MSVNAIANKVGQVRKNKFGFTMEVVEYSHYDNVLVKFLDFGITKRTTWKTFLKGHVKSPYDKSVYGVGYLGEGIYTPIENGKRTRKYKIWQGMLERCYDEKSLEKLPTYIGCSVAEEWHNFQNFAAWYDKNYYTIEGEMMCLDKDMLIKGNKVYSPDACVFAPNRINVLLTKTNSKRGEFPIGVSYNKRSGKFQSRCAYDGKLIHIDFFDTPEEAFLAYKTFKEYIIKEVAENYKDRIPNKLYYAMKKYIVEITD